MSEIEWKNARWKGAYSNFSVKELLTILKGFGPMEILEFERSGCFRGQLSLSLSKEGIKEITLYHLEVLGDKRRGNGRLALLWLRQIFKGEVYVEDPGVIRVRNADLESRMFWVKMFREGLVQAIDGETCSLHPSMTPAEVDRVEEILRRVASSA